MPEYILPTIFQAIENNDEALLKRLLDKRPVLAMKRDVSGTTALMLAARLGRTACLRVLVPLSDPLAVAKQGYSALVIAAQRMWPAVDCVEALLPLSSPLETDSNGGTALIWAAAAGHVECVKALLPRSDPLAVDKRGTSALMEAVLCGELDCVHVLLPLSDPMAVRDNGRSALMSRPSWAMRTA